MGTPDRDWLPISVRRRRINDRLHTNAYRLLPNHEPRCTTDDPTDPNYVDPETCDDWDIGNLMIVPYRMLGDYYTFHTVPERPSEFFTVSAFACEAQDTQLAGGHSPADML